MVALVEAVDAVHGQRCLNGPRTGSRVGLVPTMGALHGGHARLIECCPRQTGLAVVSIFVNPPSSDRRRLRPLSRSLDRRPKVCDSSGAAVVFAPTCQTMYPNGP